MADIADRASVIEMDDTAREINKARAAISSGPGRMTCLECGEPIPEARQRAIPGCQLCVRCQAEKETTRV
jgi:phage/conjugal plasmid C-4 type zinc finger TraR family protein